MVNADRMPQYGSLGNKPRLTYFCENKVRDLTIIFKIVTKNCGNCNIVWPLNTDDQTLNPTSLIIWGTQPSSYSCAFGLRKISTAILHL